MNHRYHQLPQSTRPSCPVCKKAAYSRGGIHPQCAMAQADLPAPKKPVAHGPVAPVATATGKPGLVRDGVPSASPAPPSISPRVVVSR